MLSTDLEAIDAELKALRLPSASEEKRQQPKSTPLSPQFPRTVIHHEPENTQCTCVCQLQRISEDVSEKLDYTPGVFTVEQHVRGKWACRQCETLIQAPVPAQVIDKGIPTAGLLAHVMVRDGLNLIIGGPTGVGKTWLACALAHKACRDGYSVRYLRLPRLMEELGLTHGDGRFAKLMAGYTKTDLLILDDRGLAPFTAAQRLYMLELLDDRYNNRSTLVSSQMPVDKWHALIGDPTLGDAILDRLVHNAYRIELKGESMRRRATKLTATETSD